MAILRTDLRRSALIAAALALICSAFLILPSKADSAPLPGCTQGMFCLYDGSGGTGTRVDVAEGGKDEEYTGTALSVMNNTDMWACVYSGTRYGGSLQTVMPGNSDEYVTDGTRWVVASYKLVPTRALCFTGYERCENGEVCTFAERNGRGPMAVHIPKADATGEHFGNSYGPELAPTSVWNRTDKHLCFYLKPDYTGTWAENGTEYGAYVVLRGQSITLPTDLRGDMRSHELVHGTSECQ